MAEYHLQLELNMIKTATADTVSCLLPETVFSDLVVSASFAKAGVKEGDLRDWQNPYMPGQ